jgi:NADPH-dependent ferric siderophore reductase
MALDIDGHGGELRRGTKRVATLAAWQKRGRRVTFATDYVNAFEAGRGDPTEIVLPVSRTVRRFYPIVAFDSEAGRVDVDLMHARSEKTL